MKNPKNFCEKPQPFCHLKCLIIERIIYHIMCRLSTPITGCNLTISAIKNPHLAERTFIGGPDGIRTHGLCVANAALSQLSYEPLIT